MKASKPSLIMMCGLPASGKTTAAGRLFQHFGGALIRSCDLYQELGIVVPVWVRRTQGFTSDMAEYEMLRDRAYRRMAKGVDQKLADGCQTVIVDFAHPEYARRRTLYQLSEIHGAQLVVLLCRCSDLEEVRRRFEARRGREAEPEHEASDWAVFLDIERRWQDPGLDPLPAGVGRTLLLNDTLARVVAPLQVASPDIAESILAILGSPAS